MMFLTRRVSVRRSAAVAVGVGVMVAGLMVSSIPAHAQAADTKVAAAQANVFPDVGPGNPFAHNIAWLVARGITTGYGDGTFRPRGAVHRGAMAAFLHRFANL